MIKLDQKIVNILFSVSLLILSLILFFSIVDIKIFGDEIDFIQRNSIEGLNELIHLLDKKSYDSDYYRPIGNLFAGLQTILFNTDYFWYRLSNLSLHLLNSIVLFIFLKLLFAKLNLEPLFALFVSLAFFVFPAHDLSVLWITGLFERIFFLFYLSGLIFFILNEKVSLIVLFFVLIAFLSKEMAISFPLVVFSLSHFAIKTTFKRSLLNFLISLIPIVIVLIFRFLVFQNNFLFSDNTHQFSGAISLFKNLIIYFGFTLFPIDIFEIRNLFAEYLLLFSFLFLIGIAFITFKLHKQSLLKNTIILFILAFVTLLPVLRLFMKWYLYLPTVFIIPLIFISAKAVFEKHWIAISISIIFFYTFVSVYNYNGWKNYIEKGYSLSQISNIEGFDIDTLSTKYFITIPAKVDGYPALHLQYDKLFNFINGTNYKIEVLSRSVLNTYNDEIKYSVYPDSVIIQHNNKNYIDSYGYENFDTFDMYDYKEKPHRVKLKMDFRFKNLYFYSNGKFFSNRFR